MHEPNRLKKRRSKSSQLKYKYGITIEQYDQMFNKQGGLCAICGASQAEIGKTFAVDHCHETGKVRGLLCGKCNIGIGHFDHDFTKLINAAVYLDND